MDGIGVSDNFLYCLSYLITYLLVCDIGFISGVNVPHNCFCSAFDGECKPSNNSKIKTAVLEWWRKSNISEPHQCNSTSHPHYKGQVLNLFSRPTIKSFPCKLGTTPPRYFFRGKVKDGYLEGKGKLKLLNKTDWFLLSEEAQNEIKNNNVCYDVITPMHKRLIELVGTFKHGLLHGMAKATLEDTSILISEFRNGHFHGFRRDWDEKKYIIRAGIYHKGLQAGYHWTREHGHLLYADTSVITDDHNLVLVFAFSDDGSLHDPIVGNYQPHLSILENVHTVELQYIISHATDCVLRIGYKVLEKENYNYILRSKTKFPTFNYKMKPLCKLGKNVSLMSTAARLSNWFISVDKLLDNVEGFSRGHEVLWHLRPDLEQVNMTASVKLISDVILDPIKRSITARIFASRPLRIKVHSMHIDKSNLLHGYCDISVSQEDEHLIPRDRTIPWTPTRFAGIFTHGNLNGITFIEADASSSYGYMSVKNGVLHGPCVMFGIQPLLDDSVSSIYGKEINKGNLQFKLPSKKGTRYLGYYKNGFAEGNFWAGMLGGAKSYSHLHGHAHPLDGTISGRNISYIYPDMETAFLGTFEDRVMKDTQESTVLEVDCDDNGLLYVSKYAMPESSSPYFYYDPPTNESYGGGPSGVRDPYERKWLELKISNTLHAGEGIFINRDVGEGVFVSIYSGFVYNKEQSNIYLQNCENNTTKTSDERKHCSKYSINLSKALTVNIPPEYDQPGMFLPTLGPKVNHHFEKANSYFQVMEHPRYGWINGLITSKPVTAGEELYTTYGYRRDEKDTYGSSFAWYWELKRRMDKEARIEHKQNTHAPITVNTL